MDAFRREFLKRAEIGIAAGTEAGSFDVRRFGATGDGNTIDTATVNQAIDAAAAAGGGTVRFPRGTYACYSISEEQRSPPS